MLYISNETESNYEQNARKHKNDNFTLKNECCVLLT